MRGPGSDITAVVLTLAEATTERATASLRHQTIVPAEVLVQAGVAPFSAALNSAAARVRTPFFVQVDADMVLGPDCLESLRAHMQPGVGAVVGVLDDPLMGRAQGGRRCSVVPASTTCRSRPRSLLTRTSWPRWSGGAGRCST